MVTKNPQKSPKFFSCENCNYITYNKKDYTKHILTRKHQMVMNDNKMVIEKSLNLFTCGCGNTYKHKSGYCRHKKICKKFPDSIYDTEPETIDNNNILHSYTETNDSSKDQDPSLIMMLVKQNKEFKDLIISQNKQIIELSKNGTMNNCNNTTTMNSHNNTFNLQFFLNETCKDAMNITDFVNSLKLTLQDLEQVGELGYAEGISRMFVKGLNDLEVTRRPIHCSDLKREVLHIKDKDIWEKDDNKDKLTKAIKNLSNRNLMLLDDWRGKTPGCTEYNNRKNDMYLKMVVESCGPADTTAEKKEFGKIIRTIAKNKIIDREIL